MNNQDAQVVLKNMLRRHPCESHKAIVETFTMTIVTLWERDTIFTMLNNSLGYSVEADNAIRLIKSSI